jgi:hypothetical protein
MKMSATTEGYKVCGQCASCRAGMNSKPLAELETTCENIKPKLTKITAGFYQLSMGALGYANLHKRPSGWAVDIRYTNGGFRRSAGIWGKRADGVEEATAILRLR